MGKSAPEAEAGQRAIGIEADLTQALFFARTPGGTDRQELRLDGFSVQVWSGAQTTRSHLSITVGNPSDIQVEAVMRLPIPPGAAVTRAVLFVGEAAVEGAFVARDRASAVYRAITERRRDPALVTWSGPDFVEVSVFPVEKKDKRTFELEWIEPSATRKGCMWYRVPAIAHEGKHARWASPITVDGVMIDRLGRGWLPLAAAATVGTAAVARAPGEPFGYVFSPAQTQASGLSRLVLVAETSRMMSGSERKQQRAAIEQILDALPEDARLSLLAVDWAVAAVAEDATPAEVRTTLDHLDGIASAGALDLERALLVASARARAVGASRIVYLGHGVDSFGGDAMAAPLRQMQEAGQNLVVVGSDAMPMMDLAALTGGHTVPWSRTADVRIGRLLDLTPAALTLETAERYFPLETVTGETRWLARFVGFPPSGLGRANVRELEALWTRAHVAGTAGRDTEEGVRHRVLTPLTSILVLESMAEYRRWGIAEPKLDGEAHLGRAENRPRSGSIGRDGAVGRMGKRMAQEFSPPASILGRDTAVGGSATIGLGLFAQGQVSEANGLGGLGLVGTGSGAGYGQAMGILGGRSARAPSISAGQADVRGALDKESIRRIIRRHMNEVMYCYETELVRKPELAGRIVVQFTIAADGKVVASVLQSSTMGNRRVENCVVQAVRRWEFLKPVGGGLAIVAYPFNFMPGSEGFVPRVATPIESIGPPWDAALAIMKGREELKARLDKIAAALAAPASERPAVLAYWIVERYLRSGVPVVGASILAGNLLREANQPHEATRILSEAAEQDISAITAEFRRWASTSDFKRLTELASRK